MPIATATSTRSPQAVAVPSDPSSAAFPVAAALIVEIAAARLMSPFFGNNVFVWSALISVTLAALAVGYWLGGRVADGRGTSALLDLTCATAAIA